MKTKSYALKPWWPRATLGGLSPISTGAPPDPLTIFRREVAVAARRRRLPITRQDYAVAAVNEQPPAALRPDLARQAQEWVTQHQKLPRPPHRPRIRLAPRVAHPHTRRAPWQSRAYPVTLEREALVTRLIDRENLSIRETAARLGLTRERVRQIHARAYRRHRQSLEPARIT